MTLEEQRERCPDIIVAMLCNRYDFNMPWPDDPDEVPCWRLRDDEWSRATGIPVPCPARTLREFLIQTLPHEVDALRQLRVEAAERRAIARLAGNETSMVPVSVGPMGPSAGPTVGPLVGPQETPANTGVSEVPTDRVGPLGPEVGPVWDPSGTPVGPIPPPKPFMPSLVVSNSADQRREKAIEWISNYHNERGVWPTLHVVRSSLGLPKSTAGRYREIVMGKQEGKAA